MINLLKEKYTAYKKRGFTLIELIVVMAIIAVLVLLAAPRFMGQTEKAKAAQIQNDIRAVETKVDEYLIEHGDLTKWGAPISALDGDGLYNKRGEIDSGKPITGGPFWVVPEEVLEEVKSHLDGTFYSNNSGEVYYSKEEFIGSPSYTDEEIDDLVEIGYIPIATADELNNVRLNEELTYGEGTKWEKEYTGGLDKKYVQVANLDLSEYSEEGWNPIGTYVWDDPSPSFTGTYDGGNYVIEGLEVKGEGKNYQGLFGYTDGAIIRNVGLIDNKVTGKDYVGGLVGRANNETEISNSYATGPVEGIDAIGGLVGYAMNNNIENSYATGPVTGEEDVGGLVGQTYDTSIENSYATGSVEGTGDNVGGLVGFMDGTISNSYATGSVEGTGDYYVGGLAGYAYNISIENSYATGSVTGTNEVGGLVGRAQNITTITNSYATGKVTGSGDYVGGLLGYSYKGPIDNSYATGKVTGSGDYAGGLVGYVYESTIENSYAIGSVTGNRYAGGLLGNSYESTIENSYATGSVTGTGDYYAGGLLGYAGHSTISNSYATGPVTGTEEVGGLVGRAYSSSISNSYSTGSVEGDEDVGGLVGRAYYEFTIENSYTTGSVKGSGDYVGGLVGDAAEYGGYYIGDSYMEERKDSSGTITRSYWDTQTTGQLSSDGGEGKTTEEMMKQATYSDGESGWNFDTVWKIDEGNDYPKLR